MEHGVVGRSAERRVVAPSVRDPVPDAPATAGALTATELRVVELLASGLSDRAIGSLLSLSPEGVEANLQRVYCKLGISTRGQLAADRQVS